MKKILILGSLGQSFRNFRGHLILDLIAKGYEVHACAPGLVNDQPTYTWLISHGVTCHNAPFSRATLNPVTDLVSIIQLYTLIKTVKPHIFIAYTIKPIIWGGIAARLTRVRTRVALITGLGYAFTGKAKGKRWIIQNIAKILYKVSLNGMHQIFFQNPDDKKHFKMLNILPNNTAIDIVNGSGVDLEHYIFRPLPAGPLKFLLIARLLGDKGIREYVSAAAIIKSRHDEIEFHLVGGLDSNPNGIKASEVSRWVKDGLIIWHGVQDDVRPFIENCHVYVLPSYREGTPRSVLEAMSMGRAIITTDAPGCRETVSPGKNGLLVKAQSTESLVNAMTKFIDCPALFKEMGMASRDIVTDKYDVHKVNAFMLSKILD